MNNEFEKVSVIVPIHNVEKYLKNCINSLLAQDHHNYEIILINDGSPDRCGEICDEYAKKDNRIQVIHQENAGVSAARNAGLVVAKGKFITFVDPDDWVDPDYISTLVSIMQPGGMAVCGVINEYEAFGKEMTREDRSSGYIEMDRTQAELSVIRSDGMRGFCWSKMFDMAIIRKYKLWFHEGITQCEDHLFVIQYLSNTSCSTKWTKYVAYHYRQHSESVMNARLHKIEKFDPKIFSMLTALQMEEKYLKHNSTLSRALVAQKVVVMAECLHILVINKWYSMPYYPKLRKEARAGLPLYLQSDIGESTKRRICTILCCLSPRLYHFIWKFLGYLKGEHRD